MGLSVTVLGCSGTYASAGGACSGYLVRSTTTAVWLDCGPGTLGALQEHVSLTDLDAIVVSHEHPDHWLELPVVANALRYGLDAADGGLPLYWTAGVDALFHAVSHRGAAPTFAPTRLVDTAEFTVGDLDLRVARTDHPVETYAVRVDHGGRSVVYSADTGNGWDLTSVGRGVDRAFVEATLAPEQADDVQHLTAAQAGAQAARAGVASLVLTHLAPGADPDARRREAATTFDGPLDVAAGGRVFPV